MSKGLNIIIHLLFFAIIAVSPIFMFSAYEKSDFFLSFDKFKLNQYKIDSLNIYSSGNWGGPSA
ncbi:hypothetical protein, partial [Tenacibaculum maritimum]